MFTGPRVAHFYLLSALLRTLADFPLQMAFRYV